MYSKKVLSPALIFLLISVGFFQGPGYARAVAPMYDFDADRIGEVPANMTVTTGTFEVADQSLLGNSLRALSLESPNSIAGIYLDKFASSSDYSITWQANHDSSGARDGFMLRAQSEDSTASGYVGLRQGYLFQTNHNTNNIRIYRFYHNGVSSIMSKSLVSTTTGRYFKAQVEGTELSFYYSDNEGSDYTLIGSTTDSWFSSGGVQYVTGFGDVLGKDYVDNISQELPPGLILPDISGIASSVAGNTATISWVTNESATSTVEYGPTTSYGSATTSQALLSSHSIDLVGLATSTLYHYRITATDLSGNTNTSSDQTFTTASTTGSISITSPVTYQVIQRDSGNHADIAVSGTYTGTPTAIEASWDGGAYTAIDSSLSGGTFSGTLSDQTAGQGTLSVRFANDTTVATSTDYIGVGDIFVIAGQSNASGRGSSNQSYSSPVSDPTLKATLFGNDDSWKDLVDPTDSNSGQVDSVSSDSALGSGWPLVATAYLEDQDVPVAFVPTAKGGSTISQWQPNAATNTLYGSMARRIDAVGGSIKGVLWFQGETDAANGTSRSTYLSSLNTLTDAIYADFGVKTIVGQIGNNTYVASNTDSIRLAQIDSWETSTTTLPGPAYPDVNISLHFTSNDQLQTFADRWWAAIKKDYFGGADGRGPRLASAYWGDDTSEIILTFTDESLPLLPATGLGGFSVTDDGVTATISSATRISNNQIKLTLASAATGTTKVSLASGKNGAGVAMPTDSSTFSLPAETFVDEEVTDEPAVIISAVSSGTPGETSATITWTTDEAADSQVNYGLTASYTDASTLDSTMATSHSVTLSGLAAGTAYHYQVASEGALGGVVTSSDLTFTTAAAQEDDGSDSRHRRGTSVTARVRNLQMLGNQQAADTLMAQYPNLFPPSATPTQSTFTRDLMVGATGGDVIALQQFLIAHGCNIPAGPTGYFGAQTRAAVATYQAMKDITPTAGYFGPLTRASVAGQP